MQLCPRLVVTDQDFDRIQATMRTAVIPHTNKLAQVISCAEIVSQDEIASKVVTMNSVLTYEEVDTGNMHTIRLVYPHERDSKRGWVSVLEPLGIAVMGLHEGQKIDWMASYEIPPIRIIRIIYQPEAAGDWTL